MDDNFESNQEWSPKYSPGEQECINYIEALPDIENEFESEKCNYDRKLWTYFQTCALAIAQLYRDNVNMQHNLWNSFQQASTNVACLYKECSEFQKKMYDGNYQNGYQKRTKELLTWAKKKKNNIRRDELIAFLSGRPTSHMHSSFYHHRLTRPSRPSRTADDLQRFLNSSSPNSKANSRLIFNDPISEPNSLMSPPFNNSPDNDETNLETFREAISTSLRNSATIINSNSRRSPRSNIEDLNEFINQEYHRHVESRKRTSSMDVCMDSPTHNKRTKFC